MSLDLSEQLGHVRRRSAVDTDTNQLRAIHQTHERLRELLPSTRVHPVLRKMWTKLLTVPEKVAQGTCNAQMMERKSQNVKQVLAQDAKYANASNETCCCLWKCSHKMQEIPKDSVTNLRFCHRCEQGLCMFGDDYISIQTLQTFPHAYEFFCILGFPKKFCFSRSEWDLAS